MEELAETFLRDGLMRAEGWERPDDSGAEFRKARQIIEDNTSMRLCEEVLEAGCPPEELSISADIHPNLREWAEERGIRYVEGQKTAVRYPPEYGRGKLANRRPRIPKAQAAAASGTCPKCGTKVFRIEKG